MTLIKLAAVVAVVALLLNYAGILPSAAEAAPKWQVTLQSDAGATGTTWVVCLNGKQQTIQLQSLTGTQYCVKTCPTATCAPDCAKDFQPMLEDILASPYTSRQIEMGADQCVVARAVDGGNPLVRLYLVTKNP